MNLKNASVTHFIKLTIPSFHTHTVIQKNDNKSFQGGIITRILASRMQRSLEPWAKFSAELMQNDANSAKPMRHTRYSERSMCSNGLG